MTPVGKSIAALYAQQNPKPAKPVRNMTMVRLEQTLKKQGKFIEHTADGPKVVPIPLEGLPVRVSKAQMRRLKQMCMGQLNPANGAPVQRDYKLLKGHAA